MANLTTIPENYRDIRAGIVELLKAARSTAARNVNSIMTADYWEIGRRIVETEQAGAVRANYGDELIKQLANDLSTQFGRIWRCEPKPDGGDSSSNGPRKEFFRHRLKNRQLLYSSMMYCVVLQVLLSSLRFCLNA
jgi:hypothetical protein